MRWCHSRFYDKMFPSPLPWNASQAILRHLLMFTFRAPSLINLYLRGMLDKPLMELLSIERVITNIPPLLYATAPSSGISMIQKYQY